MLADVQEFELEPHKPSYGPADSSGARLVPLLTTHWGPGLLLLWQLIHHSQPSQQPSRSDLRSSDLQTRGLRLLEVNCLWVSYC